MSSSATRACVLALIATWSLCACADAHGGGLKPHDSTETGNPPVIDSALVALVVSRDEVHVTGEPGAVKPGGGEVEVERLVDGEKKRGPVAGNGSFDVAVEGSLDDTYVLRALGKKAGVSSAPVYLYRGGALVGEQDGGAFPCAESRDIITSQFDLLEAQIDLSCASSADCGFISAPVECPAWYCGVVGSRDSQRALQSSIDAIGSELCQPFADSHQCIHNVALPSCFAPGPVACVEGRCMNCAEQICPADTCKTTCSHPRVTWRTQFGPSSPDVYTLADCTTLSHSVAAISASCSTELPCVGSHMDEPPVWSATDLENALGDADVQAALAADTNFGALTPAGNGRSVEVGDHSIFISASECGSNSACNETPPGVLALLQLLDDIAAGACMPSVSGELDPKCLVDFDRGDGSASEAVYAFQKGIGTCVPKVYSGSGGNDNRFDTMDACRSACPATVSADSCPPNRKFIAEACLGCGLGGGCLETAPICALLCTTSDECADELGACGTDGVCGVGPCF